MKKYIICLILSICCSLTSFAQLPREICGFKLGVTTKSEVLNYFKANNLKYGEIDDDDSYVAVKTKFQYGGVKWPYLAVFFYNDKLYKINLNADRNLCSFEELDEMADKILDYLMGKYEKYIDEYSKFLFEEKLFLLFEDGKTNMTFYFALDETDKESLYISFADKKIEDFLDNQKKK